MTATRPRDLRRLRPRRTGRLRQRGRALPREQHRPADLRPAARPVDDPECRSSTRSPASTSNAADPRNLFRVHWYNATRRRPGPLDVPDHVELPPELTGVDARIVLAFGNRFPMIGAHKVLAAYSCLVARLVTGRFDPTVNRAIWPSTGNYARGGVAISRIMGCRGVAVLPEGMSRERFEWLDRWIEHPDDVIRTPGTESNVQGDLRRVRAARAGSRQRHPQPVQRVLEPPGPLRGHRPGARAGLRARDRGAAGHASPPSCRPPARPGTLGAGDYLKDTHGARIVAVEALECPTMLYNGFGDHNIQGIGDKHIPLIHNVTNTDLIVGISDRSTDALDVLFNTPAGHASCSSSAGSTRRWLDCSPTWATRRSATRWPRSRRPRSGASAPTT